MIGDRETRIKGHRGSDEHQLDSQRHLKTNVSSKVLVILLCDSSTSVRKESGVLYMSLEINEMMGVNNQNDNKMYYLFGVTKYENKNTLCLL